MRRFLVLIESSKNGCLYPCKIVGAYSKQGAEKAAKAGFSEWASGEHGAKVIATIEGKVERVWSPQYGIGLIFKGSAEV